jgi:uncharacterized protein (TIGR03067 family)
LESRFGDGGRVGFAEDHVKQTTIAVEGNTFCFPGLAENATARAGTLKLDATKKEMDSTSGEEKVLLGIHELQRDRYEVCFAPAGKPRPTKFGSEPGSGQILQLWHRQNTS